jgi:DNA repair protein RadD
MANCPEGENVISIENLLSRADDETLQQLIGRPALRLLNLLDREMTRPSTLRSTVCHLHTPKELLLEPRTRVALMSLLSTPQAVELVHRAGLRESEKPFDVLNECRFTRKVEKDALLAFFGLANYNSDEEGDHQSPASLVVVCPSYGLFDHQRLAAIRVQQKLQLPGHRVVLHMPTGSGKTRTAMHIIADHLRERESGIVLWLASTEELCEQAAKEFEQAWTYLGDTNIAVQRLWANHSMAGDSSSKGFVVASLQKLYSLAKSKDSFILDLADRTTLAVIDEAHQAIAPTYKDLLELVVDRKESTKLLGLTATPGRTWNDPEEDERLSDFFHRQKVTLEIPGYSNPVDYLIDQGYLARPSFESLEIPSSREIRTQVDSLQMAFEIPDSILQRLGEDEQRNLLILNRVERLAQEHQRIIVFAPSVSSARLLATVLSARGANAAVVTGETEHHERARIIEGFRSNSPGSMILVNYGVLTTGFDAPRTSAAVIARPTKSLVLYSQMVGRATRGRRAGGNATATIITVVDTALPGFGEMSSAFTNWEDIWL